MHCKMRLSSSVLICSVYRTIASSVDRTDFFCVFQQRMSDYSQRFSCVMNELYVFEEEYWITSGILQNTVMRYLHSPLTGSCMG